MVRLGVGVGHPGWWLAEDRAQDRAGKEPASSHDNEFLGQMVPSETSTFTCNLQGVDTPLCFGKRKPDSEEEVRNKYVIPAQRVQQSCRSFSWFWEGLGDWVARCLASASSKSMPTDPASPQARGNWTCASENAVDTSYWEPESR